VPKSHKSPHHTSIIHSLKNLTSKRTFVRVLDSPLTLVDNAKSTFLVNYLLDIIAKIVRIIITVNVSWKENHQKVFFVSKIFNISDLVVFIK